MECKGALVLVLCLFRIYGERLHPPSHVGIRKSRCQWRGHAHAKSDDSPSPDQLQLLSLTADATEVTLSVEATGPGAPCSCCGEESTRIHSRYLRHLADLPWQELPVRLRLHVRRFFCDNPACERQIFTERLPGVAAAYGRRTSRLDEWVTHIGFALGGEAGARLLGRLGVLASGDTVLRYLHTFAVGSRPTPRVLSVDDFAFCRGRTYGSMLVDLEEHQVVDLLPDRSATTLAAWLRQHPGIAVISRDRSGEYAEGAHQGAPDAIQVADRFHLLKNLGETVQRVFNGHSQRIARISTPETGAGVVSLPRPDRAASRAQTQVEMCERFDRIHALASQDMNKSAIARALGLDRHTVQKYLRYDVAPVRRAATRRTRILDPYQPYLLERWKQGCDNAMGLWREIRARGYPGSYRMVARFVAGLRTLEQRGASLQQTPASLTPRQAARLLLVRPERRSAYHQQTLEQLRSLHPDIETTMALFERFADMIRNTGQGAARERFDRWLVDAEQSTILAQLCSFVTKLRQDEDAVLAGLELPYSQGQTEGQINKLKLIKRSMYGRAGFELLRQRILYVPAA